MSDPLLIVPACGKGLGGGHLSRSLYLLRKLAECGRDVFLWIHESLKEDALKRFGELFASPFPEVSFSEKTFDTIVISRQEELLAHNWKFIIFDNFRTSPDEFEFWSALPCPVPLVAIDEGGPYRDRFDFLIDLLPGLQRAEPNISAPSLLPLPKNRRPLEANTPGTEDSGRPRRILISFGAEDSANLGHAVARFLSSGLLFASPQSPVYNITLIAPNLENINREELPGVHVAGMLPDLKERLADYDLFITHFGLGAFEAVYARVPVLLLSPTSYHEQLAKNAGFITLNPEIFTANLANQHKQGTRMYPSPQSLVSNACSSCLNIARRYGLEEDQKEDIASCVNRLDPTSPGKCPACGEKAAPETLARFPDETYRRCPRCGMIYLARLNTPPIEYDGDYFFDVYKKQYGKTYLEDFPALMLTARKRLERIKKIMPLPIPHSLLPIPFLLDIGCAYGPFLAAAAENGFVPAGIEPIEDAVRYVKEELGFRCWQGFFPAALPEEIRKPQNGETGSFDVITLWYVIEHFRNPGEALVEIHRLLKDNGVLAVSTPSYSGISGRKSLRAFLEKSPGDHWTVWNPGICKKIFRQYGFELRKIVVTGHHPERFPFLGRFVMPEKKGALYGLLLFISRLFRLGDTFEAYGVKKNSS